MSPKIAPLLKRVVDNAKRYFKEPRRFDQVVRGKLDQVVRETLGDEEDEV